MFERLTETAGRTLFFARQETTDLGGAAIEAEHLLLGLLRADKGPTPHVFAVAALSYSDVRAKIREHWGVQQQVPTSAEIPFSDQSVRVLQYAAEEADRLGHREIGAGHFLFGVLREDGSFAAGLLRSHGVTIESLRERLEPESKRHDAFDAVVALERIRILAEVLSSPETDEATARLQMDEIHHHLDALKQHLA